MSKKNKKKEEEIFRKGTTIDGIKVKGHICYFALATFKTYKKDNMTYDEYESKKELKKSFYMHLVDIFPDVITFVIQYGYITKPGMQEFKNHIFNRITDPDFIKSITKSIKKGDNIPNIKLLPIILKEILERIKKENDNRIKINPNEKIYDITDILKLDQKIMKKKLKKLSNAGVSNSLAFDVVSIIPHEDVFKYSRFYRVRSFYDCLYEYSKSNTVPFKTIVDIVINEDLYPAFITFALLERKEKFAKLTDSQKSLYLEISTWCFNTMNKDIPKEKLKGVLTTFLSTRKKDESQNKDSNRRFQLNTLDGTQYPRIVNCVEKIIEDEPTAKKYF